MTHSVFLLSINEVRVAHASLDSEVIAVVASCDSDNNKLDVKKAANITVRQLLGRVSHLGGTMVLGNFSINNADGKLSGTGKVGIAPLLRNTTCKLVAIAQIRRMGENEAAGYLMCDRSGNAGSMSKKQLLAYMRENGGESVQNMKYIQFNPAAGVPYIAAQEPEKLCIHYMGCTPKRTIPQPVPVEVKSPAEVKKQNSPVDEKKAKLLQKIRNTKLASVITDEYEYDAIQFLLYLAKKRRKYSYLLNPKYSAEAMNIIHDAYCEGLDISVLTDPSLTPRELHSRFTLLQCGVWYDVKVGKL